MRPAIYAFCAALAVYTGGILMKTFLPGIYDKVGAVLAPAAINCIVLSMPLYAAQLTLQPHEAVGFAIGTGVAFFFRSSACSFRSVGAISQ